MEAQATGKIFLSSLQTSSGALGKACERLREGAVALRCGAGAGWVGITGKRNKIQRGMEEGRFPQPLSADASHPFLHTTFGGEEHTARL